MIYTNVKMIACVLVAVLIATTLAKPGMTLQQKLARLLMNPEHNDQDNEIFDREDDDLLQRNQLRGMLLQNTKALKDNLGLKNLFKNFKGVQTDDFFEEEPTTTTPTPIANMYMVGMAPFRSIFNRFMDMLRQ